MSQKGQYCNRKSMLCCVWLSPVWQVLDTTTSGLVWMIRCLTTTSAGLMAALWWDRLLSHTRLLEQIWHSDSVNMWWKIMMMSDRESLSFLELHFFLLCCYTHSGGGFCSDVSDVGGDLELHSKMGFQQEFRLAITIKTTDNGGIYLFLFWKILSSQQEIMSNYRVYLYCTNQCAGFKDCPPAAWGFKDKHGTPTEILGVLIDWGVVGEWVTVGGRLGVGW